MNLREYQEELSDKAVKIIKSFGLVCFAMEVRTGKTLTSLATAKKNGAKCVLFVTKLKAISSVLSDFKDYNPGYELITVNFESIHKVDCSNVDFIIVDEAHKLGAFPKPNKIQKQLKEIVKELPTVLMSGTFTPESFSQYYHILSVNGRNPFNKFKNFYAWAKVYVDLKQKFLYGRQLNDYSYAKEADIRFLTDHLFLSYTQVESGFNQQVEERVINIKMADVTYNLCRRLKSDRVIIGKTGTILADTEVKLMNKMHQLFSGTVKLEDGSAIIIDRTKANYIFNTFFNRASKIAIFYKFIEEGNLLRDTFPCHTSIPEDFNKDCTGEMVFIGQIQSNREGVNLSTADYLIMYNIDYAAVSYFQARARMQSKDRLKPAIVYWLFAENSLDQKIYDAVKNKKNFTLSHFKKHAGIKTAKQVH